MWYNDIMDKKMVILVALAIIAIMNITAFVLMGHDKRCARQGKWRVPEKTLFLVTACFGGLGGVLGMKVFHHKTQHWYFKVFFPVLLVLQIVVTAGGIYLYLRQDDTRDITQRYQHRLSKEGYAIMKLRITGLVILLCLAVVMTFPATAEEAQSQIERAVVSYAAEGTGDSFEGVLEALLDDPEDFSIQGYEEFNSKQEKEMLEAIQRKRGAIIWRRSITLSPASTGTMPG